MTHINWILAAHAALYKTRIRPLVQFLLIVLRSSRFPVRFWYSLPRWTCNMIIDEFQWFRADIWSSYDCMNRRTNRQMVFEKYYDRIRKYSWNDQYIVLIVRVRIEMYVCKALRTACIHWINRDFSCFPKLQEMKKKLLERLWYPGYHA